MENNFNELATALCEFQKKIHAVGKNKSGYKNDYTYADLGKVIEFVYPTMTELGLSICQVPDRVNEVPALTTILFHTSGQFISGTYPIGNAGMKTAVNTAQQFGAALSFARRYGVLAILGIATADDDAHCLGDKPNKAKDAAKQLGMEATEVMSKAKCLKAIEKATNGEIIELYKTHMAKADKEGWTQKLVDTCAARKDELSNTDNKWMDPGK